MTAPPVRSLICMACDARWVIGDPPACTCTPPADGASSTWLDDPTFAGALLRLGWAFRQAGDAIRRAFPSGS